MRVGHQDGLTTKIRIWNKAGFDVLTVRMILVELIRKALAKSELNLKYIKFNRKINNIKYLCPFLTYLFPQHGLINEVIIYQNTSFSNEASFDFIAPEVDIEQQQILEYVEIISSNLAIDHLTLQSFSSVHQHAIINYYQRFKDIMYQPMPYQKEEQREVIQILTLCFYKLTIQQHQYLHQIENKYQNYLKKATFVSKIIIFHEKVRKFCKQLKQESNLVKSRKILYILMNEMKKEQHQEEERLQYLSWRIDLCIVIYQLIFKIIKIERLQIISLMKRFKPFKKSNQINIQAVIAAFRFITESFLNSGSDLYQFFSRQLKVWKDQISDMNIKQEMKKIIDKCHKFSSEGIFNMLNAVPMERKNEVQINAFKNRSKIIRNVVISQERLIKTTKNSPRPNCRSSHRSTRRRLSKEKSDECFRKVDLFLKTRQQIKIRSLDNRQKTMISFTESQFNIVVKQQLNNSRQKPKGFNKRELNDTLKSQKSFLGTAARKFRKKFQMYNKIKAERREITSRNLGDQKFLISQLKYERCKITKEQILLFNNNKKQEIYESHKFKGSSQDLHFDTFSLSFFTIFNSEYAFIQISIRNEKPQFMIKCSISSTYCHYQINLQIQSNFNQLSEFSVQELQKHIIGSTIYYEALQEKIERKISVLQLQGIQEMLKDQLSVDLGKSQLTKLLTTIDILQSEFFWYYGKSCYITGNRLQKRGTIQFENLSAFAVSLGKFKSDYFSCLDEIQVIENVSSIVETFVYLSHGRMIVHKQFRLIKGKFYLQVIKISKKVYKSFSRKFKKLFFNNTMMKRILISLQEKPSKYKIDHKDSLHFDLKECLNEENTFVFLMKNIVENMIEKKYLKKIQNYLDKLSIIDNFQYFAPDSSEKRLKYSLETINNDLQINEINFKQFVNAQIINLRSSIRAYCEAYLLHFRFKRISTKEHILKINQKFCIVKEVQLQNGLKILQVYKNKSRSTYKLFFYHEEPLRLNLAPTPFQNRMSFVQDDKVIINLVRKQKRQKYIQDENIILIRKTIKYQNSYCFVSITDYQSLSIWRIDYYFPATQEHYSTYFNPFLFLSFSGKIDDNMQILTRQISSISIDSEKRFISKNNKRWGLFKSLGRMTYEQQDRLRGSMELIMSEQGLQYMLLNYKTNHMSLGSVKQIKYNNKMYTFSSILRNKMKIDVYHNIILRLYNQLMAGHITSEIIDNNHFQMQ